MLSVCLYNLGSEPWVNECFFVCLFVVSEHHPYGFSLKHACPCIVSQSKVVDDVPLALVLVL